MFPQFIPRYKVFRSLAFAESGIVYDADGNDIYHMEDYDGLVGFMFSENIMLFVSSITNKKSFPFLDEAVHDEDADVICSSKGSATSIKIRRGNSTRWIATGKPWGEKYPSVAFISELERTFKYVDEGCFATPTALGMSIMRRTWGTHRLKYHTASSGYADAYIREHMVGGRCDTPGLGNYYREADLYDMSSGYLSEFDMQADGPAYGFTNGRVLDYHEWFARCTIRIKRELPLGPFPVRAIGRDRHLAYPTLPGEYTAYLWSGQAEDTVNAGCYVRAHEGYGWKQLTSDTMFWCKDIYRLRIDAPDKKIASFIKLATVAAIGSHGSAGHYYSLIDEEDASSKEVPLCGEGQAYTYFIREKFDPNPHTMIHWYARTLQKVASKLYKFSLPFAEKGRLVATNYDGVITTSGDEHKMFLKRHSPESIFCAPGTWLWEELHNLTVLKPRTFDSDEMKVFPGRKR